MALVFLVLVCGCHGVDQADLKLTKTHSPPPACASLVLELEAYIITSG